MTEIVISQSFKQEDLKCCVCLDYLSAQIYQCPAGPHYACGNCAATLSACPVCRNVGQMVRALYFEKSLQEYLVACPYADRGCFGRIFGWDDEHADICKYRPYICPNCHAACNGANGYIAHLSSTCEKHFTKIQIQMKKPKFKCIPNGEPVIVEVQNRYYIVSTPLHNTNKICAIAIDESLIGKSLFCGPARAELQIRDVFESGNYAVNICGASFVIEDVNFIPETHVSSIPDLTSFDLLDMINNFGRTPFRFPGMRSSEHV